MRDLFPVFLDGCGVSNLTEPVVISLRHLGEGTDRTAAYWDFDVLEGYGGWRAEGCQLIGRESIVTTVSCRHLGNVAVLMVGLRWDMVQNSRQTLERGLLTGFVVIHPLIPASDLKAVLLMSWTQQGTFGATQIHSFGITVLNLLSCTPEQNSRRRSTGGGGGGRILRPSTLATSSCPHS